MNYRETLHEQSGQLVNLHVQERNVTSKCLERPLRQCTQIERDGTKYKHQHRVKPSFLIYKPQHFTSWRRTQTSAHSLCQCGCPIKRVGVGCVDPQASKWGQQMLKP